ncbi:MAG: hypothetical protein ACOCV7_05460, partial [Desulfonatronovibrionaceae bacterium]
SDCAVAGQAVRLGEKGLVLAGGVFFWILLLLSFLASRRGNARLWQLVLLMLLGALAFDGALLGFQFISIKENCHLCIVVGLSLAAVLVLVSLTRKQWSILILGVGIWVAGAAAGGIIQVPDRTPLLNQVPGIAWSGPEAEQEGPEFHYFFSLHCPHCADVLGSLALNDPERFSWKFYPLDTGYSDLKKIAWIQEEAGKKGNLLQKIVDLEQDPKAPDVKIPDNLTEKIFRARSFFQGNGYRGVPMMIADYPGGKRVILLGGGNIMKYFQEQGLLQEE